MNTPNLVLATAGAGLCACASAPDIVAEKNPAYADTSYSRVLVYVDGPGEEWHECLETFLVHELEGFGVLGVPGHQPADDPASDVEAVLVVTVGDAGVRENWVEQRSMTSTMSSNTLVSFDGSMSGSTGGSAPAQCKTTGQSGAGFATQTPWAVIVTSIIDTDSRETVWKAATEFEGATRSNFEDLRHNYARTIARQMAKDGLW